MQPVAAGRDAKSRCHGQVHQATRPSLAAPLTGTALSLAQQRLAPMPPQKSRQCVPACVVADPAWSDSPRASLQDASLPARGCRARNPPCRHLLSAQRGSPRCNTVSCGSPGARRWQPAPSPLGHHPSHAPGHPHRSAADATMQWRPCDQRPQRCTAAAGLAPPLPHPGGAGLCRPMPTVGLSSGAMVGRLLPCGEP